MSHIRRNPKDADIADAVACCDMKSAVQTAKRPLILEALVGRLQEECGLLHVDVENELRSADTVHQSHGLCLPVSPGCGSNCCWSRWTIMDML